MAFQSLKSAPKAFGRVTGGVVTGKRVAPAVANSNLKFEARFTRRMNWAALVILFAAFKFAGDVFGPQPDTITPLTNSDQLLFQVSTVLMAVIGVVWLWMGLSNAVALTINNQGVSAFTLFGTQRIAWTDIDRVELKVGMEARNYGRQIWIHAAWGSNSKGLFHGIIPVYLEKIDRPVEEIMAAMRAYRPDIELQDRSLLQKLCQLVCKPGSV
jgi:branched-subunit amino acid transport protein